MARNPLWPALAGCAVLAGCASVSPSLQNHEKALNERLGRARELAAQAAASPGSTERELKDLLNRAGADRPVAAQREDLERRLKGMARSESAVLDEASIGAFPHLAQRRLEFRLTCLGGLAQAHVAAGETDKAQDRIRQARELLDRAGEEGFSPVFIARQQRDLYDAELAVARARKRRFSGSLAKLAQASMADYLASPKAAEAWYDEQGQAETMEKAMIEIDDYIEQVNIQRILLANQRINAVSGAISSVSAAVNQYAVSQALRKSGGVVTPEIERMKMNSMMVDFQRKVLSMTNESFAKGVAIGDSMLGSAGISNLAQQLADPSYGPNAADILGKFADEVASLNPPADVKQDAEALRQQAKDVKTAQGRGDEAGTIASAGTAMKSLLGLQGKLEAAE